MLIKIEGRELPFPQLDTLTFREAGLVKKATGLRLGDFEKAFGDGDTDMIFALALVAKSRADGVVDTNVLLDLPITAIEIELEAGDIQPDDADPTPPAAAPEPEPAE